MKIKNPKLNGYVHLKTKRSLPVLVKHEHGDIDVLEHIKGMCEYIYDDCFDYDEYISEADVQFLGEGSFSFVFEHPDNSNKVIKLMARYKEDTSCYQYLRLCKDGAIPFDWIPNVHAMGRLKLALLKGDFVDMAYVVLDRLEEVYNRWDDATDCTLLAIIHEEFKEHVWAKYFPYAKLDIRGANVLADSRGNRVLTDPVWNQYNYPERSLKMYSLVNKGQLKPLEGKQHACTW